MKLLMSTVHQGSAMRSHMILRDLMLYFTKEYGNQMLN